MKDGINTYLYAGNHGDVHDKDAYSRDAVENVTRFATVVLQPLFREDPRAVELLLQLPYTEIVD